MGLKEISKKLLNSRQVDPQCSNAWTQRVVDIRKRKRAGGRLPLHEQKPIGQTHLRVGLKLSRYREVDHDMTCTELANVLNTNRVTARLMELGIHDFKLSELITIAEVVGISLPDLIDPEIFPGQRRRDNTGYYSTS